MRRAVPGARFPRIRFSVLYGRCGPGPGERRILDWAAAWGVHAAVAPIRAATR